MNLNINTSYNVLNSSSQYPVHLDTKFSDENLEKNLQNKLSVPDDEIKLKQKIKEEIHDAVMMNLDEVKNFLFMLIGSEVHVKQEPSAEPGSSFDMTA